MKKYCVMMTGLVKDEFYSDDLKSLYKQAVSYGRLAYRLNAKVAYRVYDTSDYESVFNMYTRKSATGSTCRLVRFNACAKYGDLNLKDDRDY